MAESSQSNCGKESVSCTEFSRLQTFLCSDLIATAQALRMGMKWENPFHVEEKIMSFRAELTQNIECITQLLRLFIL